MTYNRPEITVLGEASFVIQGPKSGTPVEPNQDPKIQPFELED